MKISLPKTPSKPQVIFEFEKSLIIIGANGSGKTRLGLFIEQNYSGTAKRISAQRLLEIPDIAPSQDFEQAIKSLVLDRRNRPVIEMHNDFSIVLAALFSEENRRNKEYTEKCVSNIGQPQLSIPQSAMEKLLEIWKDIFPHRDIEFKGSKVIAKSKRGAFSGRELSDGEKIALYLLSQIMCMPSGALVIVDEPELHLHRSLMNRLWMTVEKTCPDLCFIYITHDLEFANGMPQNKKIWVKGYDGAEWDWQEVPAIGNVPEDLILEIIGTRKDVIFIEGEKSSLDRALYEIIYKEYHLVSAGGCSRVIDSAKGFRAAPDLHDKKIYGLIDLDLRSIEEIDQLKKNGIHCLSLGEVENVFLTEIVLNCISRQLKRNEAEDFNLIKNKIIEIFKKNLISETSKMASHQIEYKLSHFNTKAIGIADIDAEIKKTISGINVEDIYNSIQIRYEDVIAKLDYSELLRMYTNKGLINEAAMVFSMRAEEVKNLAIRILQDKNNASISDSLRKYLKVSFD